MPYVLTTIVRTSDELLELTQLLEGSALPIGFDTETSGPSIVWRKKSRPDPYRAKLTGFSVSLGDSAWYVPVDHAEGGNIADGYTNAFLQRLFDHVRTSFVLKVPRRLWAHNWKFDLQVMKNFGINYGNSSRHLFDSLVAGWLAGWGRNKQKLALKKLSIRFGYGASDTFEEVSKKRQARDIPIAELAPYAGRDPWLAVKLGERAMECLARYDLVKHFSEVDMPLVEILRGVEEWGTPTDRAELEKMRAELVSEAKALAEEFEELTTSTISVPVKQKVPSGEFYKNGNPKLKTVEVGVDVVRGANILNDHQVSRWLYEELKVWPTKVRLVKGGPLTRLERNGAGHYPVDKETLSKWLLLKDPLGRRLAELRLEHARRTKLITTYLDPMVRLPEQYADGFLHCSYNLTGTETQRFSSSNPNLQNVPSRTEEGKRIRRALVARLGWTIIIFDYSQIELRLAAHLSQDEGLLAAYLFEEDLHQMTLDAMRVIWPEAQRGDAKINNFSTIYRISPGSLAVKIRNSEENAQKSIEAFYKRYPRVATYHRQAIAFAAKHGYAQTIDGFKRFLDTTPRKNRWSGKMEMAWSVANEAINTPIQGSAAALAKRAMIDMHDEWQRLGVYGSQVVLAGQEHDSILAEARDEYADEAMALMKSKMEHAAVLRVPLVAEGGKGRSWSEAKG